VCKIARWFHFELLQASYNECAYSEIKFVMITGFKCLYMTWAEMAEHEGRNK
jgi:hypothetical protein